MSDFSQPYEDTIAAGFAEQKKAAEHQLFEAIELLEGCFSPSLRRRVCEAIGARSGDVAEDCRACEGVGMIAGFLLGTIKKCPACDGRGVRG